MGRKAADYTGQRFNMLTAVRNTGEKLCRGFLWEWKCDCGNLHVSLPGHVVSGSTKSCGCYRDAKSAIASGEKYGRLTAVRKTAEKYFNAYKWEFLCDCGKTVLLAASHVMGTQRSCGCSKLESKPSLSHGHSATIDGPKTPTYASWSQMKSRCNGNDPKTAHHYKGRGIKVCDRWANSFENFLADMGERPEGTSLDRWPDMNGNYEPGNCRWATQAQQLANTRRTIFVEYNGARTCLKHACINAGISYDLVRGRIRRGVSPQEAFDGSLGR
jgi:hypothetical protein